MPTVEEAKKMRCPYLMQANIMRDNPYELDDVILICEADKCPKWHWEACYKDSCIHMNDDMDCNECKDQLGYCGG